MPVTAMARRGLAAWLPVSRILWAMIGVGLVVRVVVAFSTYGVAFDINSYAIVEQQLQSDPLHLYSALVLPIGEIEALRWPYPPGFFAWILVSAGGESSLGLPFHGLVQLPSIVADAALALLVYVYLGWRGRTEGTRLLAAGLIALGPSFMVVSGYHGQVDSIAFLPAVAALIVWERRSSGSRAISAGLLIGIGAAIKTVPLLLLLALLPSARSLREALTLSATAVAVPLALILPFAIADFDGAREILGYSGAPGVAGVSLLVQPDLAEFWLLRAPVSLSGASQTLTDVDALISLAALGAIGLFGLRFRPRATDAAVLLWLGVYAFSPNLFLHYAVWGLPFFLLAGYVREVLALQLLLLAPTIAVYLAPWEDTAIVSIYVPIMIALWIAAVLAFFAQARRIAVTGV